MNRQNNLRYNTRLLQSVILCMVLVSACNRKTVQTVPQDIHALVHRNKNNCDYTREILVGGARGKNKAMP